MHSIGKEDQHYIGIPILIKTSGCWSFQKWSEDPVKKFSKITDYEDFKPGPEMDPPVFFYTEFTFLVVPDGKMIKNSTHIPL